MKKKWVIVVSLVLIALLARWGYVYTSNSIWDYAYTSKENENPNFHEIPEAIKEDKVEVATYLWSQTLEEHMWYRKDSRLRIWTYRIDNVTIYDISSYSGGKQIEDGLYFSVTYSVFPCCYFDQTGWATGNGNMEKNGWVSHMYRQVIYSKEGSGYRFVNSGSML